MMTGALPTPTLDAVPAAVPVPRTGPARTDGLRLEELLDVGAAFVTTEYASLTRAGAPVTAPVTPYRSAGTLDVSTGLTYPLKAERARRDPRVTLSFSDPTGSGLADAPVLVVKGLATVRDADLVATSRRYLAASRARFPGAYEGVPAFVLRRMAWYWARVWVEVTPVEALWWADGDLGRAPLVWRDPTVAAPPSDPAPTGPNRATWGSPPPAWEPRAAQAVEELGLPVLTLVDGDGWPLPLRTQAARRTASGFELELPVLPEGVAVAGGPACLTFHHHAADMEHQENLVLVGVASVGGDGVVHLEVERSLTDLSIPPGRVRSILNLLRTGRALRPHLAAEAARRGQAVPTYEEVGPG